MVKSTHGRNEIHLEGVDVSGHFMGRCLCVLPWIHSHITNAGEVMVCCVSGSGREAYPVVGNVYRESLSDIFRSPNMERIRGLMAMGEWPPECDTCRKRESLGMDSFRKQNNRRYSSYFVDLERAPERFPAKIRTIDIRPSNICNFRCRMCSGYASSQWFSEHNLIYPERRLEKPTIRLDNPRLWHDIFDGFLDDLEEIHIAGGEPLVMDEHLALLSELLRRGKVDTLLYYDTNLSVLTFRGRDILSLWDRFSRIKVSLSLDGVGGKGEYIRYGLDYDRWLCNVRELLARAPHVEVAMHFVVSIYNVIDFRFHYDSIRRLGIVDPDQVEYTLLEWPPYLSVQAMPNGLKRRVASDLEDMLSNDRLVTVRDRKTILALIQFMNVKDAHRAYWGDFLRITRQLDAIRGQDCLISFPILREFAQE